MAFKVQCDACPEIAKHKVVLRPVGKWAEEIEAFMSPTDEETLREVKLCDDCLHTAEEGFEPVKVDGIEYYMWGYRGPFK